MNNIQKQMDSIARDESEWGKVIDTRDSRAVGKTFNIEKVAEYFGFTVIKKYHGSEPRQNVEILQHANPHHVRGKNKVYIIDEGYSLSEIFDFMQSGKVSFALWTSNYEKDFEKLEV